MVTEAVAEIRVCKDHLAVLLFPDKAYCFDKSLSLRSQFFLTALTLWSGKAAVPLADSPCTSHIKTTQTEKQKEDTEAEVEWCDVLI